MMSCACLFSEANGMPDVVQLAFRRGMLKLRSGHYIVEARAKTTLTLDVDENRKGRKGTG